MCRNIDGFRLSTYFHKDREGKIVMGPVWDYNLSLGNTTMRGGEYPEGWYSESISPQDFTYLDRLFDDPNFVIQHWDRYYQLRQTTLRTDKLMRQIDDIADHLAEAQARNFKRWPYLGSQVWQNPAGYRSRNTHRKEVDWLKRWLTKRLAWMDEQFTPPPTISLASGQVTAGQSISLTAHSGAAKIYLSMDGSDPRQTSGTPATNATAASPNHQMTLKQSSQVRARALVNGQWGALASANTNPGMDGYSLSLSKRSALSSLSLALFR